MTSNLLVRVRSLKELREVCRCSVVGNTLVSKTRILSSKLSIGAIGLCGVIGNVPDCLSGVRSSSLPQTAFGPLVKLAIIPVLQAGVSSSRLEGTTRAIGIRAQPLNAIEYYVTVISR